MKELWQPIIAEALERGVRESKGPVPGAKLRQIVAHTAVQKGLKYPPEGFESETFGEFLRRFDSAVLVLRRKSQDFLVAPATQPELLARGSSGSLPQLRSDIFDAFTRIPKPPDFISPWYNRLSDTIIWLSPHDPKDSESLASITPASIEQEVADRKIFAQLPEIGEEVRENLLESIKNHGQSVLWAFAQVVRSAGLSRKWHVFRFQQLNSRIRAWSEAQQIAWREDWLVATEESADPLSGGIETSELRSGLAKLQQVFAALEDEDLRRISIPLDVVLKLLRR